MAMSTGYDGRAVANYVLDFCASRDRHVTNLSLQKIIYFCHVWSLIELRKPLVRQSFEAWEYGPVLPYLYREFKKYDRSPIVGRSERIDPFTGGSRIVEFDFDSQTTLLLERIVDFYSRLPAGYLVDLSHAENGPWHSVWNHGGATNPGMKISNAEIEKFYERVMRPFSLQ